jgi:hypothetical protein
MHVTSPYGKGKGERFGSTRPSRKRADQHTVADEMELRCIRVN